MATLKPFAALRPKPELAGRICELPYDVMSSEEARRLAEGNPLSFLHVSKPEIDLPPGTDPCSPQVYARGRENLDRLIEQGALRQDSQPAFYLYQQCMGDHRQTGLVAAARCQEYLESIIRKHEFTRPDKEEDRVRHMEALNAQTGPVFLTYRSVPAVDEFVATRTAQEADVDFTARDGVRHTAWTVRDKTGLQLIKSEFQEITPLYIADGHHRSAAAARVHLKRHRQEASAPPRSTGSRRQQPAAATSEGPSAHFLTVIFPHNQVRILPYNRVLKDLNKHSAGELLTKLGSVFEILPGGNGTPSAKHELGLFIAGHWHTLRVRSAIAGACDPIDALDVSLLQNHVLSPIFGVDDPRTSRRIRFVGGIRGPAELEKLVNDGQYACAFSMFPTSIDDLMSIADARGIMPPKSTWFEPKLRDGMFCHLL